MVVVDRGENSSSSSAVTTAAALVHFAPSSAVEFQLDVPVSRSLTPMPAHVAAQRFPTEPKAVSVDEQAAIDEAKRNDALLKEWDSLLDDDEIHGEDLEALFGPEANRRRRRRESFYLASTSSDPLIKATIGSARLTGCATITGVLENSNNNNKVCSDDYSMDSISIDKSGPLRSDDFRFNEAFRMNSEDSLGMSTEDDDEDKEKLPNLESLDILTGSPVELEAETGNEMILKNVDAQRPKKVRYCNCWP